MRGPQRKPDCELVIDEGQREKGFFPWSDFIGKEYIEYQAKFDANDAVIATRNAGLAQGPGYNPARDGWWQQFYDAEGKEGFWLGIDRVVKCVSWDFIPLDGTRCVAEQPSGHTPDYILKYVCNWKKV